MFTKNFTLSVLSLILAVIILFPTLSSAQMSTQWIQRYNGSSSEDDGMSINASKVDGSGNLYVTGWCTANGTSHDYITLKYNSSGSLMWSVRYTGLGGNNADEAFALEIDASGNVYVTGKSWGGGSDYDAATIKYNSSGQTVWVQRYNGADNGPDWANAITLDPSGNVIVGGRCERSGSGTNADYLTIKYNSAGTSQWSRIYNGPGNVDDDRINSITTDISGNIYVTGKCGWTDAGYDFVNLKYSSSGTLLMTTRYNGSDNSDDEGMIIRVDAQGNFYVTGHGFELIQGFNITTIKFSPTGLPLWIRTYGGYSNGNDEVHDMEIDNNGNVYICGASQGNSTNYDYVTVKYNSAGTQLWAARMNGPSNSVDLAYSLALDSYGNVYVTGASMGANLGYDFATVKYSSTGVQLGNIMRYNGTDNQVDIGYSITATPTGSIIYVSGSSRGSGTNSDIVTIKYGQTVGIENVGSETPNDFSLSQNYPNPFNPTTNIEFSIPVSSNVKITVYDIRGKEVEVLVNEQMNAGIYVVDWNASTLSSGTYFYTIKTESFSETKKMMLIK